MSSQVFSHTFDPILLPNETATLFGNAFPADGQPVRCRAVGALPEYQKDFGSLTAGSWSTDNEDTNLEMGSHELAQLRMRILDDFKLQLKHPSAYQQWRTNAVNFYLKRFPYDSGEDFLKELYFRLSEFFIWEKTTPRFDLYSISTQTSSRIVFTGWKFKIELITKEALTSKQEIWTNSWPSGK